MFLAGFCGRKATFKDVSVDVKQHLKTVSVDVKHHVYLLTVR